MLGHFLKHFKVTVSESVVEEEAILLAGGMWDPDYMDDGNMFAERASDLEIGFVSVGATGIRKERLTPARAESSPVRKC